MSDNDRTSPGEIETGIAGRACEACHKKKTKCDMQQPVCGLCRRTNKECHFPSTRKRPSRQEPSVRAKLQKVNGNLDRLVELLEKNPGIEAESLKGILTDKDESKDVVTDSESPPGRKDTPTRANIARSSVKDEDTFSHTVTTITPAIKITTMSYELATHLVDVFFYNIHPWLSIFHQPRFMRWMKTRLVQGPDAFTALTMSERTLFNAMFALSARWSNHALLANLQPRERGEKFMKMTEFWFKKVREIEEFDLTFLKAVILLAYYHYASGCTKRGWFITHMCVRGAYELGLHQIDESDDLDSMSEADWVEKESLRRLFWAVYELDQFGSIVKRKPFGIDYRHVDVKMPVCNEAWLSGNKVDSAKFIPGGECWKTLVGSSNQDERAWTLLAKTLVGHVFDLMLFKDGITNEQITMCENNISCFKMAMPESLQLTSPRWSSVNMPIARKNWITATNLYLACASFILTRIPVLNQLPSPAEETKSKDMAIYMNRVSELNEILKRWPREALQFAHPLSICTILTYDESLVKLLPSTAPVVAYRDLSGLILEKIAQRWQLGAVLLRVRDLANDYQNSDEETRADLVRQYPVFFDREIRKRRKTVVEEANRIWTPSATSPSASTTTRRSIDLSHSPEHMVQQQLTPAPQPQSQLQKQSPPQTQPMSQVVWQPPGQPTSQPQQISQSSPELQQQSLLQPPLDQSQLQTQLEQPQFAQQLQQQQVGPTSYSTQNPTGIVYEQPNDIGTVPSYQDWNSFGNVMQSPEDIDSLFSGFLQEPWWQDYGGVNFVV